MKKTVMMVCTAIIVLSFSNCVNKETSGHSVAEQSDSPASGQVSGVPCDLTIQGIHFSKSVNNAAKLVTVTESGKVVFKTGGKTDYFSDPNGKLSNTTAPILLTQVDNTKPFTFTAKVSPDFSGNDLYNAGVLYVYINDSFFQKHCFEQDERGKHRIVTVRTIGSSDDSNHDVVEQPYAYMKISSDTHTIASYYSLDNENWQMVRLYENTYPSDIWIGISAQCPMGNGAKSDFESLSLEQKSVSDFRLGI